jgi:hypothetical protein
MNWYKRAQEEDLMGEAMKDFVVDESISGFSRAVDIIRKRIQEETGIKPHEQWMEGHVLPRLRSIYEDNPSAFFEDSMAHGISDLFAGSAYVGKVTGWWHYMDHLLEMDDELARALIMLTKEGLINDETSFEVALDQYDHVMKASDDNPGNASRIADEIRKRLPSALKEEENITPSKQTNHGKHSEHLMENIEIEELEQEQNTYAMSQRKEHRAAKTVTSALKWMSSYWIGPDGKFNLLGENESHVDAIPRIAKMYGIIDKRFSRQMAKARNDDGIFEDFVNTGFVRFFNGHNILAISKAPGGLNDRQVSGIMGMVRPGMRYYVNSGPSESGMETLDPETLEKALRGDVGAMDIDVTRVANTKRLLRTAQDNDIFNIMMEMEAEDSRSFVKTVEELAWEIAKKRYSLLERMERKIQFRAVAEAYAKNPSLRNEQGITTAANDIATLAMISWCSFNSTYSGMGKLIKIWDHHQLATFMRLTEEGVVKSPETYIKAMSIYDRWLEEHSESTMPPDAMAAYISNGMSTINKEEKMNWKWEKIAQEEDLLREVMPEAIKEAEKEEYLAARKSCIDKVKKQLSILLSHAPEITLPMDSNGESVTDQYIEKSVTRWNITTLGQCDHLALSIFIDLVLGKEPGYQFLGQTTPRKNDFFEELITRDLLKNAKDLRLADAVFNHMVHPDLDRSAVNERLYLAQREYKKARAKGWDHVVWRMFKPT